MFRQNGKLVQVLLDKGNGVCFGCEPGKVNGLCIGVATKLRQKGNGRNAGTYDIIVTSKTVLKLPRAGRSSAWSDV